MLRRPAAIAALLSACSLHPTPSITEQYDDYSGWTVTTAGPFPVDHETTWELVRGLEPSGKAVTVLQVNRAGGSWKYLRAHELRLIVDGERFSLPGDHDGNVERTAGSGNVYVVEKITYEPGTELFTALEDAETIKGRVGRTEFSARPENVALVNQFIREHVESD